MSHCASGLLPQRAEEGVVHEISGRRPPAAWRRANSAHAARSGIGRVRGFTISADTRPDTFACVKLRSMSSALAHADARNGRPVTP
jgi:hypothetical protein